MFDPSAHQTNRLSWNAATRAHDSHKRDQARFLRDGGSTLFPEELELLGDLRGRRLVHLACNAGQDTLSLVHHGARPVGVDISDVAIDTARRLAEESGLAARFVRADVYEWLVEAAQAGERFDVAFASYGALCWLSDLPVFFRGVADVLEPGGRLVVVEFHPVAMIFDETLALKHSYFGDEGPIVWDDGVQDYVARSGGLLAPSGFEPGEVDFVNPHPCVEFQHTIGDVLGAVLDAGLTLEVYREYPYSNGCRFFDAAVEKPGRRLTLTDDEPQLPQMYALRAGKPR